MNLNSFWMYSLKTNKWSCIYKSEHSNEHCYSKVQQNACSEPCPRYAHQLVYDWINKIHYLFGGNPGRNNSPELRLDDFWLLHLKKYVSNINWKWTQINWSNNLIIFFSWIDQVDNKFYGTVNTWFEDLNMKKLLKQILFALLAIYKLDCRKSLITLIQSNYKNFTNWHPYCSNAMIIWIVMYKQQQQAAAGRIV